MPALSLCLLCLLVGAALTGCGDDGSEASPDDAARPDPEDAFAGSTLDGEPTMPWPDPPLPPEAPAAATFEERVRADIARDTVRVAGRPGDPRVTCEPNRFPAPPSDARCTAAYMGIEVSWDVTVQGAGRPTAANYEAREVAITRAKAEWEAAYAEGATNAICDMDDVALVPINRTGAFTCRVLDVDDRVRRVRGEVNDFGTISFSR